MWDSSPTIPYFIRSCIPMFPTRTFPVWMPHLSFTCGKPCCAPQWLSRFRAQCIRRAASTAAVAWSGFTRGVPKIARMASPMNSITMPPWSSTIFDMSLKYRLSSSSVSSGRSASTMLVKETMSEKKMVTSFSATWSAASEFVRRRSCTTGHGTYLPQDLSAVFMFSNLLRISRTSQMHSFVIVSSLMDIPASCSDSMLSMS
mmetsp:Transcript_121710/g.344957  ORF Transcript_121710/g.344957 Transcript_121710/m.344957 type:complete len:202 (-) Transcript_121710:2279-2884(-)